MGALPKRGPSFQSASLEELKTLIDDATDAAVEFFELVLVTPGVPG
jgi:hypothetical protein